MSTADLHAQKDQLIRRLSAARDELNRQIEAAQQAHQTAYNDGIHGLYLAVMAFARDRGLRTDETERKNVTTVTVMEVVSVDFGRIEPQYVGMYAGSLAVRCAGIRADFGGSDLPSARALVGLIEGLLLTNDEDSS